ncbi:MAG: carboxy-S-adenosyl-L-methionine synthase CmoA [Candidatus Margulisbacteria bacterium]|nr:carboxy-S-adenosyl-L-methionine synthase CmoA [Candidatus Margulisiibacteriota bacterium]
MKKDDIYSKEMDPLPAFSFNENVAEVFDDMISRSVPCYQDTQMLIANTVLNFYQKGTNIYDLGCSTGETFKTLSKLSPNISSMIGIDYSLAMIEKAKNKCKDLKNINFIYADVLNIQYENTSAVVMNYLLQFMTIPKRVELLKKIKNALTPNGTVIIFEKIISKEFKDDFISIHELFKEQQGYSKMEVKQKRQALENVLIPLTYEENKRLIQDAGFTKVEKCFQYLNFCGILCS